MNKKLRAKNAINCENDNVDSGALSTHHAHILRASGRSAPHRKIYAKRSRERMDREKNGIKCGA